MDYTGFMLIAVQEAEHSLREGNCGFGAVIVKGGEIVSQAHDTEKTARDSAAHAELTAIRQAAAKLGRTLTDCQIISTHEPCPMCATALLWAGIDTVVYGYSIKEAIQQGRNRIDLSCRELFERAGKAVTIHEGVLHDRCAVLYDNQVRDQIDRLRGADETALRSMAAALTQKRLAWFAANHDLALIQSGDLLDAAYTVFLRKLDLKPENAPIVERGPGHVTFYSRNFCPTLEACRILGLDTRFVCRCLTEQPTTELLKQIDPRLRFSRNYDTLRPYGHFCEETISTDG